jgi:CRP-like cAMP-binding protein
MIDYHLRRLRARDAVSADEEAIIRSLVGEVREYPADYLAIPADKPLEFSTLLLRGLMCRYKDLPSGVRQVTELHVPGDFADLHSFTLKRLDHHVGTLTRCQVGLVPHDRLLRMTEENPHLTRLYWFSTNLDAAIHREWEVSLGRRNSLERMAHLFCEMEIRLELVGLASGGRFDLQLTQEELAECLGITPVHVNRTLQQLREDEVVEFRAGQVTIQDRDRLRRIAAFDPGYLYLEGRQT